MAEEIQRPRAVLVTGGTGALGREIVQVLCADSRKIFCNYSRDENRARSLQAELQCELRRADVGDEAAVEELFRDLPPLLAVVHAAGISRDGVLARQSRGEWDETMRSNAESAFLVTRAALQKLENRGRLVLIASRIGERGRVGQTAYAASKAAQIALMKCAAIESAPRRILVNAICPGFVPSAMNASLKTPELEAAKAESVLHQFGNARQVASLVKWLLSEEADGITGQVFHCDSRL